MRRISIVILLAIWIQSAVAQSVSEMAFNQLLHVERFAIGGIGFAGITSDGEKNFRVLISGPQAAAHFERLYSSGNPQAKSYALLALSKLAPDTFKKLSVQYGETQVQTQAGCIVSHESLSAVIKRISDGKYDFFFADRVRKTPLPCDHQGPLLRDFSGALVQYKPEEMMSRAIHKEDIDPSSKQIDAKGFVFVDLLIDQNGRVACTEALSGPVVLRRAVQKALRRWRFSSAEMNGLPVAYTGRLVFYLCNLSCAENRPSMTIVNLVR